ncbi:Protein of unknown function [Austwickia chelonae]|uniref:DUF3349 domain-containing protein n=1 Tax=Austwickia chelonae NBRC 105200 TaxID=1184607 RepID=K6UM98_9MICO|nr:DUF3349 domain-containing protein [Austwickia chelonae]GAB77926.1 hypothetical protein AUCHE_08_01690 [Austwickia chelonae NBRC 105200]SEV92394.1 Protein of unknown function [Austwickia chelonae]
MSFTFRAILDWLRAGYPHGVPREDYIALLGVLQRHLTEQEIVEVVDHLQRHRGLDPISPAQIREAIEDLLKGHATEEDIRRVTAKLATAGWPESHAAPRTTAAPGPQVAEEHEAATPVQPQTEQIDPTPTAPYLPTPERRTA